MWLTVPIFDSTVVFRVPGALVSRFIHYSFKLSRASGRRRWQEKIKLKKCLDLFFWKMESMDS